MDDASQVLSTSPELAQAIREASRAIARANSAITESLLLNQRPSIVDGELVRAAQKQTELGRAAAAFISARKHLNEVLQRRRIAAESRADALANDVVSEALGQPVPGPVCLPTENGRHTLAFEVLSVESIRLAESGHASGVLKTRSLGGRATLTRQFGLVSGRMCVLDDVDY